MANHIVVTTDNIAGMNTDTDLEFPCADWQSFASRSLLNFNSALHRRQGAGKFDQETIPDCLDFRPLDALERLTLGAGDIFEQLNRERLVALHDSAVTDHVREHIAASLRCSVYGAHVSTPDFSEHRRESGSRDATPVKLARTQYSGR